MTVNVMQDMRVLEMYAMMSIRVMTQHHVMLLYIHAKIMTLDSSVFKTPVLLHKMIHVLTSKNITQAINVVNMQSVTTLRADMTAHASKVSGVMVSIATTSMNV